MYPCVNYINSFLPLFKTECTHELTTQCDQISWSSRSEKLAARRQCWLNSVKKNLLQTNCTCSINSLLFNLLYKIYMIWFWQYVELVCVVLSSYSEACCNKEISWFMSYISFMVLQKLNGIFWILQNFLLSTHFL